MGSLPEPPFILPMMTIGHSTLAIDSFLRALTDNGVKTLVDVRRYPGSKRHPQFSQAVLFASLADVGIRGVWRERLGGRRVPREDSVNTAWRNASFRGYADYMQSDAFAREIDWLTALPEFGHAVVMCAEAIPWRCHRSLIADALIARGFSVEDIFVELDGASKRKHHELPEFAQVRNGRVLYPSQPVLF